MTNPPRHPRRQPQPIDPLLQARLERLGNDRRSIPLPPPTGPPTTGVSAQANARIAALAARSAAAAATKSPAKTGRRAKPARTAKLASLALSAATTLGLAGMFASQSGQTDSIVLTQGTTADTVATTATTTATTTDAATGSTTVATTPTTTATTAAPAASGAVLDGTYVGAADTNKWGTVQVQVVYSGGQITDVQILSYPDGERKSVSINQRALPTLISDSISTQSADVDSVSGATYTWRSYKVSLQSAIDAAKAAPGVTG